MATVYRMPGFSCTDHIVPVPLDHADPDGPTIDVYAREVVAPDREHDDLPWLLFLQGGPGGKADRPPNAGAWLKRALREFRVLLLDQRGTGRSTPVNRQSLAGLTSPEAQAEYLSHFRADAIVDDAELLRRRLLGQRPWSVLGQSYGGFCAVTYLSRAPHGLREVLITGGVPGLHAGPEEVYRRAYPRVLAKNDAYYERYPGDVGQAWRVVEHLDTRTVRLPNGERLTPERFQTLGMQLGQSARFDALHHLLDEAFVRGGTGWEFSDTFLRGVDAVVSLAERPLYGVLQESIYCQGVASRWAAHRVRGEFPAFSVSSAQRVNFTGEMIYPWHFEQDAALVPLRAAAEWLAERTDWPALYDPARLAENEVPTAAAVYHDDMYVDREHSLRTAEHVRGMRVWVTNEYEHDAVKIDSAVFDRLVAMTRGRT